MEDDKITDWPRVCPTVSQEMRMNEQDLGPVAEARQWMAEDTALQLFQIAALMLGDEQEAVSLVEEVVAKVRGRPMRRRDTGVRGGADSAGADCSAADGRAVPGSVCRTDYATGGRSCIETDDLGAAGLTGDQFGALMSGAGRAGMREWLERLAPALRAIFVLRAVAGQDGEQTAESLRQSGATGRRRGGATRLGPPIARRCARWLPA